MTVALLCTFDGADAATSFTSEDAGARAATFLNQAQLDTAQKKFGSASLLLDGTGDGVSFTDSADFTLGTGDFTFEQWVRFNALPSTGNNAHFASHWVASGNQRGWYFLFTRTGTSTGLLEFSWSTAGTSGTIDGMSDSWFPSTGVWYHVAVCKDGNVVRAFIDGVQIWEYDVGAPFTIFNSSADLFIGRRETINGLNGWVDDVRFSVGDALYTGGFTPPGELVPPMPSGVTGEGAQPVICC